MILAACEILHSPFNVIDAMEVETLIDLLDVWEQLHVASGGKGGKRGKSQRQVYVDEIL